MARKVPATESRTIDQLREQFDVERELRSRLLSASAAERASLYASTYDELFRRVQHHPQLSWKADEDLRETTLGAQLRILARFVKPGDVFLEVGAGDCRLSFDLAKHAAKVYAVEVSEVIAAAADRPHNFELIISDGTSIPVEADSVDVAYSHQLLEHLHPEDAIAHVKNIYRALKVGGSYVCVTPNRINGPWDISRYFEDEVGGVHLKEYTNGELGRLFRQVGFRRVRGFVRARGLNMSMPLLSLRLLEGGLAALPSGASVRMSDWYPLQMVLGVFMVGTK